MAVIALAVLATASSGCSKKESEPATVAPAALKDVPALQLNYRYEADVPSPSGDAEAPVAESVNPAVLADFEKNRQQELLLATVSSPNRERIVAIYRRIGDVASAYRLDMYKADGAMIRQLTPESMAVNFPEKIVWSPDSSSIAFAATGREATPGLSTFPAPTATPAAGTRPTAAATPSPTPIPAASPTPVPTPRVGEVPPNVLTFRTEQIYLASSEGTEVRAVTQNEGLIYFHFVWAPDNSALAALAATFQEWRFLQYQADQRKERFLPKGRPRVVEKNGRERLLDDNLTGVFPAWSPDSSKVAVGFDTQIRLYDSVAVTPTQAAVPLRNQMLISAQTYDAAKLAEAASAAGNTADTGTAQQPSSPPTSLPDEKDLISFQPIVKVEWPLDDMIYLQTGLVKEFQVGEGVRNHMRWHRVILSPQAVTLGK